MWARYSSAQFEQGAGRHACNNPYSRQIDAEMFKSMSAINNWQIPYEKFLNLISPSFTAIDEAEDMSAILARTHIILLTDNGIYFRVASTSKEPVEFIPWDENSPKDLLTPSQFPIFKAYKLNPDHHQLPESYHEDCAWSQEILRRLLHGERVPSSHTILQPRNLFGERRPHVHKHFLKLMLNNILSSKTCA